jgi:hypothetical protein
MALNRYWGNTFVVLLGLVLLTAGGACSKKSDPSSPQPAGVESPVKVETPTKEEPSKKPAPIEGLLAECLNKGVLDTCKEAITSSSDKEAVFVTAEKTCDERNANGCFLAGLMTYNGTGVPKSSSEAAAFYEGACLLMNAEACYFLAAQMEEGDGVPVDESMVSVLISRACENGHAMACFDAGLRLLGKENSIEEKRRGLLMLKRACSLGNEKACGSVKQVERIVSLSEELEDGGETAEPVTTRAHGIEWVVSSELANDIKIKKVTCSKSKWTLTCELTVVLPQGAGFRSEGMAEANIFDGDGVKSASRAFGGMLFDGIKAGDAVRVPVRAIDLDTKKVLIDLKEF